MKIKRLNLSEDDKIQLITFFKGKRIGIVMAGGGAKGAYQAGCIDFLNDLQISKYEFICGSSIGAINAAALSSSGHEQMVETWNNISFRSILKFKRIFFVVLLLIITQAWINAMYDRGKNIREYKIGCYFRFFTYSLIFIVFYLVLRNHFQFTYTALISITAIIFFYWINVFVLNLYDLHPFRFRYYGNLLEWRINYMHAPSLTKTVKIKQLIESKLRYQDNGIPYFNCPVFVTLARKSYWFDPDVPTFQKHSQYEINLLKPRVMAGYIPEYFCLNNRSKDQVINMLLASSSIPFVFPTVFIDEKPYIDGGVVDNLPVNKALEMDCDILVVLDLKNWGDKKRLLDWVPRLRRTISIEKIDTSILHELYMKWFNSSAHIKNELALNAFIPRPEDFIIVPLTPVQPKCDILYLRPSIDLGGWIKGTLNFSRKRARKLMDLGYNDFYSMIQSRCNQKEA